MEKFKFTQTILDDEANSEALQNIENSLGRNIVADEVLEYDSALCNGVQCEAGYVCVLGNCVKDDLPSGPEPIG